MSPRPTSRPVAEPWAGFLRELDGMLDQPVELHRVGGFVLAALHHLPRPTADVDYIAAVPNDTGRKLEALAGRESALARRRGLWVQHVTIADFPDGYARRLRNIVVSGLRRLRLRALEPHDLALSKLTRNHPVDVEDVRFLIARGSLRAGLLRDRYLKELRPYLANVERHDLTLELWLDLFEDAGRK